MGKIKQVVILAGGKGTRMREMTEELPKPMVPIGGVPVLDHLINIFEKQGSFNFIICSGYLGKKIEAYYKQKKNVKVVFTGDDTETGGRLYKVRNLLEENFLFTYGDGLANINITKLVNFHFKHNKIGTISVTNPVSRFGLIEFEKNNLVTKFIEKPKLEGFIKKMVDQNRRRRHYLYTYRCNTLLYTIMEIMEIMVMYNRRRRHYLYTNRCKRRIFLYTLR